MKHEKMNSPRVSVVIPTYNVEKYIQATIDSLLNQTFSDFEIIIVDDGSIDKTVGVIESYHDQRIILLKQATNQGPAAARNIGFKFARGEYIAVIDSDDVALPSRLAEQIEALDKDPEIGMVGSHVSAMHENGQLTGEIWRRPTLPADAAIGLLFRNTFSSVFMLRKHLIPSEVSRHPMAEDYDFNITIANKTKVMNLDRTLTQARIRRSSLTQTKKELMQKCIKEIMREQIRALGVEPSERELELNRHVGGKTLPNSINLLREVEHWLTKLSAANTKTQRYSIADFERNIASEWFDICQFASPLGLRAFKIWRQSPLNSSYWRPKTGRALKFLIRCLIRYRRVGGDTPTPI